MVSQEAFHVAQIQKTKLEAPVVLASGQCQKPVGNQPILLNQLCAIARHADRESATRSPDTQPALAASLPCPLADGEENVPVESCGQFRLLVFV